LATSQCSIAKILRNLPLTITPCPSTLASRLQILPTTSPREITMPEVIVRKGEPIDRALKRLKSKLDAEGIMDEVRRLRAFETPTQKSRRKAKANAKRAKAKFRFNPA
jgi:small subunit ribosomal protein S21